MKKMCRAIALMLTLVLLITSFAACDTTPSNPTGSTPTTEPSNENGIPLINNGEPVTIIVNLGEYAPSDNEIPTEDAPSVFNSTRVLIKRFMELHPNVTVVLDKTSPTTGGDYVASLNQWMLPRLAAGTQMDIACNLAGAELFGDSDWFIDLSDMLETPNEYVPAGQPGSARWADQWPKYLWSSNSIKNTRDKIVAIPYMLDCGSPTAYFYNKEIFEELELEIPQTWEELFAACEVIRDAGYIPFAPHYINTNYDLQNWDTQFSLGPIYAQLNIDKLDYNGDGMQDMAERVRAVKEGIYNPVTNDYAMDIWRQVKRKYNTETSTILQEGFETTDYEPLWNEGKVAIMEGLMESLPYLLSNTEIEFEFGLFPPPVISNDTYDYLPEAQFTTAGPSKPDVASSWVFLRKSMEEKDPAVKEACIAFVKFMTASENMSAVVLEKRGAILGSTSSCLIPPELEDWMKMPFPIYPSTTGWLTANLADWRQQGNKLLEQWVYDYISDEEFAKKLNEYSQADADQIIQSSGLDTSGWNITQ